MRVNQTKRRLIVLLLVVSMILSSVRFDYIGDVFAADAGATSETGEVTISTPSEAEESEAILEGEKAAGENQTELVVDEERENEEESENVEEVVDDSAKVLVVDDPSTDYSITINAPEGSLPYPEEELSVISREILPGTDGYNMYLNGAADALNKDDTETISFARFFDIEILRNGEKIEPSLPVEVKIEYDDAPEITSDAEISIIHFADDGVEVIDDVNLNNDATEIVYEQDSFSITATVASDPSSSYYSWSEGSNYLILAKEGDDYYSVQDDGTLHSVTVTGYNGAGQPIVKDDDAFIWKYYTDEDEKKYFRYKSDGYQYLEWSKLASIFSFTMLAPNTDNGIITSTPEHEEDAPRTVHKDENGNPIYINNIGPDYSPIIYENNEIKTETETGTYYLTVENGKVKGNITDGASDNVKFFLADPSLWTWSMANDHLVNHIDISVEDDVNDEVPLIYGKYYDYQGNLILDVNPQDYPNGLKVPVKQKFNVSQEQLRNAEIIAKDKKGNKLDDAFYITGYTGNAQTAVSTPQVRIEGLFKVATNISRSGTNPTPANDDPNIWTERKNNPVIYTVNASEPNARFYYQNPNWTGDFDKSNDPNKYLYDADHNKLYIETDVSVSASFNYFSSDNECPAVTNDYDDDYIDSNTNEHVKISDTWPQGRIQGNNISGMDFKLSGGLTYDLRPVAIDIFNYIQDENGNIIKLANPINGIGFNVYQNTTNPDPNSVAGKNVGSYQNYDVSSDNYPDNHHSITTSIDESGTGLDNDYDVDRGMVYVEEDTRTIPKDIYDEDGNLWFYRYTYMESEYVNRGDGYQDKRHVSNQTSSGTSAATPEVLGPYGTNSFSTFVDFYAHNVYTKITPPVKKETTPGAGKGVKPGDIITYTIDCENYLTQAAMVQGEDYLDKNVEFDSIELDSNGNYGPGDWNYDRTNHKVTWSYNTLDSGVSKTVTIKVKVKDEALKSNGGPGKVINGDSANNKPTRVKVGNDPWITLNKVENPVPENPTKVEISPYNGTGTLGGVDVDEQITYQINYKNYKSVAADVIITDTLDKNVEYIDSSDNGVYDSANHTVTWTISGVTAGTEGNVTLTVNVLDSSLKDNNGPGFVINGGDNTSNHSASVAVGGDQPFYLNEVTNPVPRTFDKNEIDPYVGKGELGPVSVGEEITYEITYRNYKAAPADIIINDKLDDNVEFVSADNGGVNNNGTVSWTIADVPADGSGSVKLTVKVLESALISNGGPGKVINGGDTATVKIGNDKAYSLDPVENPVPDDPVKRETAPYSGIGTLGSVFVDDIITYEITYRNYKSTAADIVIKDQLDKFVDFDSASDNGTVKNGVVTWTLKDVPAGKTGTVKLSVKVLNIALKANKGPGYVINGGDTTSVKVGDDPEKTLNYVENPVIDTMFVPTKYEVSPDIGNGDLCEVKVGDEITYEIFYKNYNDDAVDIIITDKLDKNVEFVCASDNGVCTNGTVKWTLKDVPAGTEGIVSLKVKVLEGAMKSKGGPGYVSNGGETATVKIGDDPEFILDLVTNPVKDEPAATVTTPAKTAAPAKTGDKMPILPVAGIMIIAVVGIVIIARKRRKIND